MVLNDHFALKYEKLPPNTEGVTFFIYFKNEALGKRIGWKDNVQNWHITVSDKQKSEK